MRAFVTGADGFIGSHLCEALRDAGHEVTGLALYRSEDTYGWLDEVEGVERVRGDVRDAESTRQLIQGHDVVFHLAALISVQDSYERPQSYLDTNVNGTLNVLLAAREAGAKVVHTSTSEVYGTAQYVPMDEKHPINPQSPYAASKVAADALVRSFALAYRMPIVTLRPFNAYGPRQSERAVISRIIRQEVDPGRASISLGNTMATRDFTYVTDVARVFVLAGESLQSDDCSVSGFKTPHTLDINSGIYNIGTGKDISVYQIYERISSKPLKSEYPNRLSEVDRLICDASKLRNATGWEPEVGLSEGIERTISWRQFKGCGIWIERAA